VSALVELRDVGKVFRTPAGPVPALRGVSLSVGAGEVCVVTGPSGSGKSTLLGLMGGLDQATTGSVSLLGRDLGQMTARHLARVRMAAIGFVFQSQNLLPTFTAFENVELPLAIRGVARRARRRRVAALLDELEIAAACHRRPAELSGGQQQRVGIARALAGEPALLLADEPTAHLDAGGAQDVMRALGALTARRGTALVFSTHDPAVAARAARRLVLADGSLDDASAGVG